MKRVIAKVLIVAMLATMLIMPNATVNAKNTTSKSRAIYVVFDNSGSMYALPDGNINKAWSQATYAMEVFASMMNYENGDVMKIFPMHNIKTTGENGEVSSMTISSQSDIEKIHDMFTPYPDGTPYVQANNAAKELKKLLDDKKKDEGWLIVLTDGVFEDPNGPLGTVYPTDELNEDLVDKASLRKNMYVQFLAMGTAVGELPRGDESVGFYSQQAGSSEEVVDALAVICNRIFKRNEYQGYKTGAELEFDVPMGKVIVFAQGKDVKINSLKNADGGSVDIKESTDVSYSTNTGGGLTTYVHKTPEPDTSLKGAVAVFADSSPIEIGKYKLDVEGADSIKVYYEPDVEFSAILIDSEGRTVTDKEIANGDYSLKLGFVDKGTGKFIEKTKLLGTPKYSLKINGQSVSVKDGVTVQEVDVKAEGESLEIEAGVKYLSESTDNLTNTYTVCTLEAEAKGPTSIPLKSMEDSSNAITVTASRMGKALTEEQWKAADLKVTATNEKGEPFDIEWDIKEGSTVATWVLTPKYKGGDMYDTDTGMMNLSIVVTTTMDGKEANGIAKTNLEINDDRTILDYLQRYWKEIVICLAILALILGYVPPFKKYLPRSISDRPNIHCKSKSYDVKDKNEKGKFERHLITTLIPYMPEEGKLTFSCQPNRYVANVRAIGGQFMNILNTSTFAGKKNIKINGETIPKEQKVYKRVSSSTDFKVDGDNFVFTCTPKVKYSAGKKKGRR